MSSFRFEFPQEEAIIKTNDRPVISIQNDTFADPNSITWKAILSTYKTRLNKAIQSVGRVELENGSSPYIGTAWMLTKDIAVTNRHVAEVFAKKEGNRWVFQVNNLRKKLKVRVDFKEEYSRSDVYEAEVIKVLYVAENTNGEPDIAFLQLASNPTRPLPPPLVLYEGNIESQQKVVVIGYPAKDSRNSADLQARIFNNIYEVKRLSPGEILEASEFAFTHDCTTLGGNSGSPVIDIESGHVVGLHFAGLQFEANYAVSANIIREYFENYVGSVLNISLPRSDASFDLESVASIERAPVDATGYDPAFLGSGSLEVPLPTFTNDSEEDAVVVSSEKAGVEKYLLNYNHFSISMSKSRRFAIYTACNINGSKSWNVKRNDNWAYDDRISRDYQWGNELYKNNDLDRGHLVRRLDPAWGESKEEAIAGANDTFFYTNCSPQHSDFNQKSWLGLEDYILNSATTKGFKATVFTGPFFSNNDYRYRGALIPLAYWKIVIMVNKKTRNLSATGYVISQHNLLSSLEETNFVFGEYKTYQTSIKLIEEKTSLNFGHLSDFDPIGISSSHFRELPRFEDIQLESDNNETKGRIVSENMNID